MSQSELFWNAKLDEMKKGYTEDANQFICLMCGQTVEKGVIYPQGGILYEAQRFIRLHIEQSHGSVFEYLVDLDKKFTGLTEHQTTLLRYFYAGKRDKEVQEEMGIGSSSTIRHHRFVLKEKERQAKTLLAIMELLKERDHNAPSFVTPHKHATMVDDRYSVTTEEQEKILEKYFANGLNGPLVKFPPKEKQRIVILRAIVGRFDETAVYNEKEMNGILKEIYEDFVLLRRYLIEYGFFDRKSDGSEYWVKK
ncbi:DUF2087 domain-containing protein [Ureibacillus sinduriensis]|uniref:Transcriptional regulator n=1 Tax=Ureibacillus sinduriensis BLB-1 = JCM 15800 TaxID=1384057 RepID=A0A0A3I3S2_9BACL|nr:DUF2087 domain-containing protein [Ureibacillus sinduriensis]KGR77298.1 transcriptional regulator [Ureibacillus sinduriensis BLB-1 = JCM 15800]